MGKKMGSFKSEILWFYFVPLHIATLFDYQFSFTNDKATFWSYRL